MSDSGDGATSAKKPNFFVRMFRGDVGLALTFWVFGIVIPLMYSIVGFVVMVVIIGMVVGDAVANQDAAVGSAKLLYYSYSFIFWGGLIAYCVFTYIAIWRSARKYAGFKLWKFLAQVYVVVCWLSLPYSLYVLYADLGYEDIAGAASSEFSGLESEFESEMGDLP